MTSIPPYLQVGWYNNCVQPVFHLPYHKDTLGILVVSTPMMFDVLVKPFITGEYNTQSLLDPVDQCMKTQFLKMQNILQKYNTDIIQDFELHPNRRPKILLQTVGHISGASYYYQRHSVPNPPWDEKTKIYGVSMHPKYGGWFAFRGVLIFKELHISDEFQQKEPINCVSQPEKMIELLERFNFNWQDWTYRDVSDFEIIQRYSEDQKEYFATLPKDRHVLVKKWIEKKKTSG